MQRPPDSLAQRPPMFLIVDDNRDSADTFVALLQSWGCWAVAAYDGAKGIELADKLRPDAVLLDLHMPQTSGFEACRAMRGLPWGPQTTVVAVTGSADDHEAALTDAGFDGVFAKPVDAASLRSLLDWLRVRRTARGGDTPSTQHLPRVSSPV